MLKVEPQYKAILDRHHQREAQIAQAKANEKFSRKSNTMSLSLGNVYDTATNQGADDGRQYIKAANLVGVPLQILGAEVRPSFFDAKKEEAVFLFWQYDDLENLGAEGAPLYAVSFSGAKMVNVAKHLLMQQEATGEFPDIAPVMLVIDSSESGEWARKTYGRYPYKWEDVSDDAAEIEHEVPARPANTGTKASRTAATAPRTPTPNRVPTAKRAQVHA